MTPSPSATRLPRAGPSGFALRAPGTRSTSTTARPARLRPYDARAQIGTEPPLDVEAPTVPSARHAISLRWLGACVLAGVAGALLLGSAIYVSSQGEVATAEIADLAPAGGGGRAAGSGAGGLRKGDKLVRAETVASAKQSFRAPMTLRAGDREVIKVRGFTRLSTALSLTSGAYATNIPPFNPMRFFAATEPDRGIEPAAETADAEVSVVKSDLSTLLLDAAGPLLSDQDVAAEVEAAREAAAEAGRRQAFSLPAAGFLPRAIGAGVGAGSGPRFLPTSGDASFRSIEVRVVPENVTNLPKAPGRTGDLAFEDRTVAVKRGDTLDGLLRAHGATPDEARVIAATLGLRDRPVEGLQLRLLVAPADRPGEPRSIVRAVLYGERGIEAIAAMNDRRAFVSVAPPPAETARQEQKPAASEEEEDDQEGTGARLYDSLYETALKHDLSRQTVEELVRIFGYDVDFQRRVAPGDSFELFFANEEEGNDRVEILSAALTVGGETRRVFRFQGDDGTVDYLDEAGRSLKKFLVRKPVAEARISSGFGSRFHPILGYSKMHTGVDWATKTGTPIFAAGNGTIIKAAWDSGYGRRIEIQHANGYVTTYNHQSAFARGIGPGVRVRQGQVIGFVGSTGLSTGAHLHYEVIVNGRFQDPMKIRVPRGRELDGRALAEFSRQRDQIGAIEKRAGAANQLAATESR